MEGNRTYFKLNKPVQIWLQNIYEDNFTATITIPMRTTFIILISNTVLLKRHQGDAPDVQKNAWKSCQEQLSYFSVVFLLALTALE